MNDVVVKIANLTIQTFVSIIILTCLSIIIILMSVLSVLLDLLTLLMIGLHHVAKLFYKFLVYFSEK
jgi:hypothetical protein